MILQPDRNVWRVERAERAAVLIDGGQYFGAVREALLNARSTVFIVGWDLDSRTRLVGESGKADDGFAENFVEFLTALAKRRPKLVVHLLIWDYSILYALERELFPTVSLHWRTPRRIRYCLDDDLPAGASHHQKIVVVDDSIAFCGGLDLTIRRWDTAKHRLDESGRVDPAGAPYPPFHDVQAVVDGKAALALAELVRARWRRGACERTPRIRPQGDPWPPSVKPDLTGIDVGIARTYPATEEEKEVREVEALFFDSVDRAQRAIYIESQYFTAARFAARLVERMRERPDLEVVIVAPKGPHSWLEAQTMQAGEVRFRRVLEEAGLRERVRLLYPQVTDGGRSVDTVVHSKIMVVDDVLLRVGSANLSNRSFGLDTECDLAFEAKTPGQRGAILRIRDRLLADHCGAAAEKVAASLARTGSLMKTAQTLTSDGHSLQPIDLREDPQVLPSLEGIGDPERPIAPSVFLKTFVGERPQARRLGRLAKVIAIGLIIVVLMLAWRFSPLATLADPDTVRDRLAEIADTPGAPAIVLAIFVIGGLLVFPVTLLIAATAATFGPWLGFAYAAAGAIASAIVTYEAGVVVGRRALEDVLGPRLNRIRRSIARRGVLAIAVVRLVPIAPYTLVNLAAGASKIPRADYLIGTILGLMPGLIAISALGHQIFSIITEPTLANVILFLLALFAWIAVSLGVQALVLRLRSIKP